MPTNNPVPTNNPSVLVAVVAISSAHPAFFFPERVRFRGSLFRVRFFRLYVSGARLVARGHHYIGITMEVLCFRS